MNIALSRTKTSVLSAFKPSLGKICLAISNFAISCFFWSLETSYRLYLKLLLKPLIETIRTFDFRIFERSMNWMFFFELCLSTFCTFTLCIFYFETVKMPKRRLIYKIYKTSLEFFISNILLSQTFCLVRESGTPL